jgi:hypothetical protein
VTVPLAGAVVLTAVRALPWATQLGGLTSFASSPVAAVTVKGEAEKL